MTEHSGQCLCGAVKMIGTGAPKIDSCHCQMCRRWHGGPSVSVSFEHGIAITEGEPSVGWYKSSDWAKRGFCKTCGSTLFYRTTDGSNMVMGEAGAFDLPKGLSISEHYFVDEAPDYYTIAGDAPKLTGAEVFAKYVPQKDGSSDD